MLFLALLALGSFPPLRSPAATVFPTGSLWRWRPGTNEVSSPVPAWRTRDFPESQFAPAPAPFWYGDVLPGGTQIRGMQNVYGCLFLRKTFSIDSPPDLASLRLDALVDDGFVAWINGSEVLRVNMPGEPGSGVTVSTLAINATEPVTLTSYELPPPSTYVVPGTNVLAVQVFQSSLASSDLGFDAALEAIQRETVPPLVRKIDPEPGSTLGNLSSLTVTFSEPVTGVVAAHLLVNGIGASSVSTLDDSTYAFTFSRPEYGAVTVGWSQRQTIADRAIPPNPFAPSGAGAGWTYQLVDRTAPIVAGVHPIPGSTTRVLERITVLFSEPVSGVDASDLLVDGRPARGVIEVASTEFSFELPPLSPGTLALAWAPAHGIRDRAEPANAFVGIPWQIRFDPAAAEEPPYLSEFMASNTRTLRDDTGDYSDWIELYNPSAVPIDLTGWYLTDSTNNLAKWRFPGITLAAGRFLVVHASGLDRNDPALPLHASFQLAAGGEYLALVKPDGRTVADAFVGSYPRQLPDVSYGVVQTPRGDLLERGPSGVYFTRPSPGAANLGGNAVPGPRVASVEHAPKVPADDQDLVVTVRVEPTFQPVATVQLRFRVMFEPETTAPMYDDGLHGDGAAGDGVYGATISAGLSAPGHMIRYFVTATDSLGASSRWPLYPQPTGTAQYLGTIVAPTNFATRLPVFHLFVAPDQMSRVDSESGGRLAFFHDGEFYDNVYMELRGNTSAGLNKKSHRLEFNRGHELRHPGAPVRTRRSSLLAEYLDPSYLRQHLCFWFLEKIGVPSPFDYPVRVQMNGQFYQLAFHNDVIGREQVERMGYDPRGALYKAVGNLVPNFSSTGVFQKLEPEGDPTRTDYLQLANGIHESASIATRRATVFDLLDVPQVINHLAGTRWCAENDDVWANMSLYRDTFGDGLWRNIPFDMNASWGQLYGGSSPLEATSDFSKSHPLYGGSSTESNFNRLYDVIVRLPETRQMLLRRQRSILDRWVQPPETPAESRILENYIRQMTNVIGQEALLDRAKWGFSPWAPGKTFAAGVNDLINQFVVPRRRHWYVTHSVTNNSRPIGIASASNAGIPLPQPTNAVLRVVDLEFNPTTGNQSQEFLVLSNASPVAVDISNWKLEGAIDFEFAPGTVLPLGGLLHVSPDVRQFRSRTSSPRGGQGLFVVGPYSGQLSARGESISLRDDRNTVVHSFTYPGAPSDAQKFLRITEIMYAPESPPADSTDPEAFEFLELRNTSLTTTLDLTGTRFTDGIEFDFSNASIRTLAPGARWVVTSNRNAFSRRYGDIGFVVGEYFGRLANGGERLRLVDASNEEILDFSYQDDWYRSTDGGGFSLTLADENAEPDAFGRPETWTTSGPRHGTPGRADRVEPPPPSGWPTLVQQPVGQGLIPGSRVVLSLGITNTALLPLNIEILRDGQVLLPGTHASLDIRGHDAFVTLSGTNSSSPWTRYAFRVSNSANPGGTVSETAILTYWDDADRDGLPDVWENAYFGSLGSEPGDDGDRDGLSLLDESVAGTDPKDPSSRLGLEIRRDGNGTWLIFESVAGRSYSLQTRSTLSAGDWRGVRSFPAGGTSRRWEVHVPNPSETGFYRVVTPFQP